MAHCCKCSCLQIWPQLFQVGYPENECYTHLLPNGNVSCKKSGKYYIKSTVAKWRVSWRLCSSSFLTETVLSLLTLPSFATTFKSYASSEIKTVLMEAFISNGIGKMLRAFVWAQYVSLEWRLHCIYAPENEILGLSFWRADLQFGNKTLRGQSLAGLCWSGDAFTGRLLLWIWPVQLKYFGIF